MVRLQRATAAMHGSFRGLLALHEHYSEAATLTDIKRQA